LIQVYDIKILQTFYSNEGLFSSLPINVSAELNAFRVKKQI